MPINIAIIMLLCLLPQVHMVTQVETQSGKTNTHAFNPGSAVKILRQFLRAVSQGKYEKAYGLIAQSTKISGDTTLRDGGLDLNRFLNELTVDQERITQLENQIKARKMNPSRESSTNIPKLAFEFPPEFQLAGLRAKLQRTKKCGNYKIEQITIIDERRVEIAITTFAENGLIDKDKAMLIKEDDKWRIANPLHILR
jgi:Domain of unknown function (DUF4878)